MVTSMYVVPRSPPMFLYLLLTGTSFREEVHSILDDIQNKYQTHWKEHEHKIQQVQSNAEHEIQTLMKNIVGKYVQLTELKDRTKVATNITTKTKISEPLYVDTINFNETEDMCRLKRDEQINFNATKNSKDLLLKIARPLQPVKLDCNSDLSSAQEVNKTKYEFIRHTLNPQYLPDGKDSTTPSESTGTNEIKTTCDSSRTNDIKTTCDSRTRSTYKPFSFEENVSYRSNEDTEYKPFTSKTTDTNKEFWRHKLLQPNPVDMLREK